MSSANSASVSVEPLSSRTRKTLGNDDITWETSSCLG
jgi:hypothetical protein